MVRWILAVLVLVPSFPLSGGFLSWSSHGPETGAVNVIRFDPGNPAVVWAGTQTAGVFRSADGGVTWAERNSGLVGRDITVIAIDPLQPSTVYVAIGASVFKSTNDGTSWASSSSGLFAGGARITDLAVDPQNPSILYASSTSDAVNPSLGVQKSVNGGSSWADSGGVSLGTKNVYALALDRQDPLIVYAGGFFDNSDRPLFKSANGGASWVPVSEGLTGFSIDAIATDPLVSGTLLVSRVGSIRRSTNGGLTWSGATGLPFSTIGGAIVYERNSSNNVWYATSDDVYRSTNGGAAWTAAKIGGKRVNGLDVNGQGLVVAGTRDSGIYRRLPGASAWLESNSGLRAARVLAIAADDSGVVHAGTDTTGMFRSLDHGQTWERPSTQFLRSRVLAVAIDPDDPSVVYAGLDGGGGFYKSTDGGTRWGNQAFLSRVYAIAVDPSVTTTIYAGTDSGVSRSGDGGNSFQPSSSGLPSFTAVLSLAVDPVSPMTVFAALSGNGVYRTSDGAATWTKKSGGISDPDVVAQALHPGHHPPGFAATDRGGVFRSSDGGESWSAANDGLNTTAVLSLWIDPDEPQKVYAGTSAGGVFQSTDGGSHWSLLGGASPAAGIVALAGGVGGDVIHAAARGGVFSYQFDAFDPAVTITFPQDGATIANGSRITADFEYFTLDCAAGASGEGRGIWRLDVDGALDAIGCGLEAKLTKSYALGAHVITFSLRNPDGSALAPPATSSVNVTIVEPGRRRRGVR